MSFVQEGLALIRNGMAGISSRKCPQCGSYNIVRDTRSGGQYMIDYLHCEECKVEWMNTYEFCGQHIILKPE